MVSAVLVCGDGRMLSAMLTKMAMFVLCFRQEQGKWKNWNRMTLRHSL